MIYYTGLCLRYDVTAEWTVVDTRSQNTLDHGSVGMLSGTRCLAAATKDVEEQREGLAGRQGLASPAP